MSETLRYPAIPLVTVDPYFSVWSCADRLYDDIPQHWTMAPMGACGMIRIDGTVRRFLGRTKTGPAWHNSGEPSGMDQRSVKVRALSTIYEFESLGVALSVRFTTPLLPDDLELLSRPFSYVAFAVRSLDGKTHDVSLYFDVTAEWTVHENTQRVEWFRPGSSTTNVPLSLAVGTRDQNILGRQGDLQRIDWGYLHLFPVGAARSRMGAASASRSAFIFDGSLPPEDEPSPRHGREVRDGLPALSAVYDLGVVGGDASESTEAFLVLGYDDNYSIEYRGERLKAYCYRDGSSFADQARRAVAEYDSIRARCDSFDLDFRAEAEAAVSTRYADLAELGYRQSIAAHKLVADRDGVPLFFSKECTSNGCIATVDVSYPSMPLFLRFAPLLVEAMIEPVFRYAASGAWPQPYAPHDLGVYPRANGQVYGVGPVGIDESRQMPVEESANLIIMAATLERLAGLSGIADRYGALLRQWCDYLEKAGFDPENQLCTDDFAGPSARNANLSIKSIVAIGAWAELLRARGESTEAIRLRTLATDFAGRWVVTATDGDHTILSFGECGTWSLKYNLVWDRLLGLGLFPAEVYRREVAWYRACANRFGTPLDSRAAFTKTDWLVWSACLAEDSAVRSELIEPIWAFCSRTPNRTPFCDWYDTIDATERNFHHRSVIGGIYLPLLKPLRYNQWP